MHLEIINRIKKLRVAKGFTTQQMSERLNIDISAYTRLESGKTLTWAKYLEDLLDIFNVTPESFFEGMGKNVKITDNEGSYGGNLHVENLNAENREKDKKIELLYEQRLKDKDVLISELQKIIATLMPNNH
jgi:transcriptional regulator with XRE-family HTH domain